MTRHYPGFIRAFSLFLVVFSCGGPADGQSLGNAGTIQGKVIDPSGAAVPDAAVLLRNPVTGYMQSAVSGKEGTFDLVNVPPNPYRLEVTAAGFSPFLQSVTVRGSVPITVTAALALAG